MRTEIRNKIKESAKKYNSEDFNLFIAEEGWQDWMNEYTEAAEGEEITESECKAIEKIQKEIFDSVHE